MDRMFVIQEIINKMRARVYLEVGVHKGECFLRIRARKKMAVDPQILISLKRKQKYYIRNPYNFFSKYYHMSSDDFFRRHNTFLSRRGLDVVFIDGLHTYEQSLRDVQNSLKYLNDGGVVIMHDCNPISEAAARPAPPFEDVESLNIPGHIAEWNGDVWKTIVNIRSCHKDLSVFVLDCDQGLGIITKRTPENVLSYSREEIRNFHYRDLDENRTYLLNLKSQDYFLDFLKTL